MVIRRRKPDNGKDRWKEKADALLAEPTCNVNRREMHNYEPLSVREQIKSNQMDDFSPPTSPALPLELNNTVSVLFAFSL